MELEHILRNFLDGNGKLTVFPAKRKMKVYCLFYLHQAVFSTKLLHWIEDYVETLTAKLLTTF